MNSKAYRTPGSSTRSLSLSHGNTRDPRTDVQLALRRGSARTLTHASGADRASRETPATDRPNEATCRAPHEMTDTDEEHKRVAGPRRASPSPVAARCRFQSSTPDTAFVRALDTYAGHVASRPTLGALRFETRAVILAPSRRDIRTARTSGRWRRARPFHATVAAVAPARAELGERRAVGPRGEPHPELCRRCTVSMVVGDARVASRAVAGGPGACLRATRLPCSDAPRRGCAVCAG